MTAKPEDMIRIKTGIEAHWIPDSVREEIVKIPRAKWDAMTPDQREETLKDIAEEQLADNVATWAHVMDEDEDDEPTECQCAENRAYGTCGH